MQPVGSNCGCLSVFSAAPHAPAIFGSRAYWEAPALPVVGGARGAPSSSEPHLLLPKGVRYKVRGGRAGSQSCLHHAWEVQVPSALLTESLDSQQP